LDSKRFRLQTVQSTKSSEYKLQLTEPYQRPSVKRTTWRLDSKRFRLQTVQSTKSSEYKLQLEEFYQRSNAKRTTWRLDSKLWKSRRGLCPL